MQETMSIDDSADEDQLITKLQADKEDQKGDNVE